MANIGSSVTLSNLTVDTTYATLTKVKDGVYSYAETVNGVPVRIELTLKPSAIQSLRRHIEIRAVYKPKMADVSGSISNGSIVFNLTVDLELGSQVSNSSAPTWITYFMGACLQNSKAILTQLISGSTE
jgi:hypothetical protein